MKTIIKLKDILNNQEKKTALLLLVLTIFSGLLDMIGVGSIMPFVGILSNNELIYTNNFLNFIFEKVNLIGISSKEEFIFFFWCYSFCSFDLLFNS